VAGARVLLSGAGPIGILAAGAAVAAGAAEVWATDLLDHPLEIAAKVGTHRTARVDTDPLPDQYFDVVVEASGAAAAVGPALSAVRRRGVVVQLGMFPPGPKPVELSALIATEVDYRGTFRFDTEFDDALALLATTTMFDPVVTHTFALAQAREAMNAAADATTSGKVVLNLSDD
jgi:L-idonate 5-dehydrogenase